MLERLVAAALRLVAARPEVGDEVGEDASLARVCRPREPRYRVLSRLGEAEGIDAEGPDDARIQALEVEQGDVPIEPRARVEDVAARAVATSGRAGSDVRGDPPAPVQARQVEVVEGGHRASGPAEGEPRDPAPFDHEVDEPGAVEDLPHEAAVLEVVGGEGEPIGLVQLADRVDPVPLGSDELVAAEKLARHRPEALVLESPERGAVPLYAVQHHPPRDPRGRHRAVEDAGPPAVASEREPDAVEAAARLQEAEIEAGDVPADDEVRVVLRDPGEQRPEDRGFVREAVHRSGGVSGRETERGWLGRPAGPGVDEEHGFRPLGPRACAGGCHARGIRAFRCHSSGSRPRRTAAHRDGPEPLVAVGPVEPRGLDVEGDGAKDRPALAGPHPGVDVFHEPLAALRPPLQDHGAGHETLHQEPVRGPHVGFVDLDFRPLAKRLELASRAEVEGVDGVSGEGRERYLPPPDPGGRGHGAGDEADRFLAAERRPDRTLRSARPQHELEPAGGIAPVAGEQKDIRRRFHGPPACPASHRSGPSPLAPAAPPGSGAEPPSASRPGPKL